MTRDSVKEVDFISLIFWISQKRISRSTWVDLVTPSTTALFRSSQNEGGFVATSVYVDVWVQVSGKEKIRNINGMLCHSLEKAVILFPVFFNFLVYNRRNKKPEQKKLFFLSWEFWSTLH